MRSILAVSLFAALGVVACSKAPGDSGVGTSESQWKERPAEWTCAACQAGAKRACAGALIAQPPFPAPSPASCGINWSDFPAKAQTCDEDGNWGACSFPKEAFDKLMSTACEVKHFAKEGGKVATVNSFEPRQIEVGAKEKGKITIKGSGFSGRKWLETESVYRAGDAMARVGEMKVVSDEELEITLPEALSEVGRNPGYLSLAACSEDTPNCFAPAILTVGPIAYLKKQPFEVYDTCPDPADGTGEKPVLLSGSGFDKVESIAWGAEGGTVVNTNYLRFQPASNETAETIRHDVELSFKQREGGDGTYRLPMPITIAPNPYRIEITDVSPTDVPGNQPTTITLKGRGFASGSVIRDVRAFAGASNVQAVSNDVLTFTFDPAKAGNTRALCAQVELTYSHPESEKTKTITSAKCIKVIPAP